MGVLSDHSKNKILVASHIPLGSEFLLPLHALYILSFFRGCVISIEIRTLAYWPMHSPSSSTSTSSTFPMVSPNILTVSCSIHPTRTLCSCTQKADCVNDYFAISPLPLGSFRTINARSKCQGPRERTRFLSASEANLNMNVLLPKLSTLNPSAIFQTCCNADSSWVQDFPQQASGH